jgi:hypothetical protein
MPTTVTRSRTPLLALLTAIVGLTLAACDTNGTTTTTPDPATVPPATATAPAVTAADMDALRGRVELVEQRIEAAAAMISELRAEVEGDVEAMAMEAEEELGEAQTVLTDMLASLDTTVTPAPAAPADPVTDPDAPPAGAN